MAIGFLVGLYVNLDPGSGHALPALLVYYSFILLISFYEFINLCLYYYYKLIRLISCSLCFIC
jgi:hypothetical protein